MKKILFLLIFITFFIGMVSASGVKFCIDNTAPSSPSNLMVSGKVGDILISWSPATDEPNCSGIEKYIISRDGVNIGQTNNNTLNFIDLNSSLGVGEYLYTVYAVDIVGHHTSGAVILKIKIENNGGGNVVHTNSNPGNIICKENWTCGNWSECINGGQRRICDDLNKCGPENHKPKESRKCETGVYSDGNNGALTLNNNTINSNDVQNKSGFFSTLTGAVTGAMGKTIEIVTNSILGLILLMLILFIGIVIKRKFKK